MYDACTSRVQPMYTISPAAEKVNRLRAAGARLAARPRRNGIGVHLLGATIRLDAAGKPVAQKVLGSIVQSVTLMESFDPAVVAD